MFWFDLIFLTFHENSNHGRENYWKFGVQIHALGGQKKVSFCFQILPTKLGIFELNHFLISCWIDQKSNKTCWMSCIYWYLICKTRYLNMVKKQRYAVFYGEFENEKKKRQKKMNFRSGDSNQRFSEIFQPMIWIVMESEEDEIKSKQASRKVRNLFVKTC